MSSVTKRSSCMIFQCLLLNLSHTAQMELRNMKHQTACTGSLRVSFLNRYVNSIIKSYLYAGLEMLHKYVTSSGRYRNWQHDYYYEPCYAPVTSQQRAHTYCMCL